jgi:hypothetical protein
MIPGAGKRTSGETSESSRIEQLRKKIDNEEYLYGAIQRIAQILSNEILDVPQGGTYHERQRGK